MIRMKWLPWLFMVHIVVVASGRAPNIIVLLCDNLGYGDTQPFWSETPHRTPCLNRMAEEGTRFTHFYVTAGVCTPSRASIMTGKYAQRVGLAKIPVDDHVLRPVSPYGLHPDELTIAEVLKQQGYVTSLIGKWHLGDQPEFLPTRQGFDTYFGIPYSDDMTGPRAWNERKWPPLPLMEGEKVVEAPADRNTLTRRYTERAIQFIRAHEDQPFFLFLSHATPGSTRTPHRSDSFRGRSANGSWGDAVEEIDWSTGQILDVVRQLKLDKTTLVLWTSDNGAPNNANDLKRGSNRPLFGRGYTTAEGGMRVPLIAWWPGRVAAGSTNSELVTTLDWLPTFAALSEFDSRKLPDLDGWDISNLLFGDPKAKSPTEALYYYQRDQLQAVRSGPWKYFVRLKRGIRHPRMHQGHTAAMLFHLYEDPGCEQNVADHHPDVVKRLEELIDRARKRLGDQGVAGDGVGQRGVVNQPKAQTR